MDQNNSMFYMICTAAIFMVFFSVSKCYCPKIYSDKEPSSPQPPPYSLNENKPPPEYV